MFIKTVTPQNQFTWGWTTNITAQATATAVYGGTSAPAAVANESFVIDPGPADNCVLQLYGASATAFEVAVFGISKDSDDGYTATLLVQATITTHSAVGGRTVFGATLYPPASHSINVNSANAKVLEGSLTYKGAGALTFDCHGFQKLLVRINTQSSTAAANAKVRGY